MLYRRGDDLFYAMSGNLSSCSSSLLSSPLSHSFLKPLASICFSLCSSLLNPLITAPKLITHHITTTRQLNTKRQRHGDNIINSATTTVRDLGCCYCFRVKDSHVFSLTTHEEAHMYIYTLIHIHTSAHVNKTHVILRFASLGPLMDCIIISEQNGSIMWEWVVTVLRHLNGFFFLEFWGREFSNKPYLPTDYDEP